MSITLAAETNDVEHTSLKKPKHGGRRSKFCEEVARQICANIGDGLPASFAAALVGVAPSTYWYWINKHPSFADAVEEARGRGLHERLKLIKKAAKKDWRAAAWWTEHVFPEHFAKTRVQVEHVGKVEHSFTIPRETLDRIAEARKRHEDQKQIEIKADRT